MAEEDSPDPFPAFWCLCSSDFGSGSGSETHNANEHHHLDLPALSLGLFNSSSPSSSLNLNLGFEDWGVDEFSIGRRRRRRRRRSLTDEEIFAIEGEDSNWNPIEIQVQQETMSGGPRFDLNHLPLCSDCLQEWEHIDDDGDTITINANQEEEEEEEEEEESRNLDWEVLLMMDDLANPHDVVDPDSYLSEGFIYTTSDHEEVLFGQFHDSSPKGGPPASKSAVEGLPSFVVDNGISCAVCKDEVGVGDKGKRLPCSHCYHEECIVTWLGMRNTCPLCRYELPTDDEEYESRKAMRA